MCRRVDPKTKFTPLAEYPFSHNRLETVNIGSALKSHLLTAGCLRQGNEDFLIFATQSEHDKIS